MSLAGVEVGKKYDGSPVLKVDGMFMAGVAMHASAEVDTLVVRVALEDRALLIAEAPDVYFITDYYRGHAVVLVRMARVSDDALRDLVLGSWRITRAKRKAG